MKILSIKPVKIQTGGWLHRRFGDHFAQISVDTTLKLKSSVRDVARVTGGGTISSEIEGLAKKFKVPPQGIEDSDFVFGYEGSDGPVPGSIESDLYLQEYVKLFPDQWAIVQKCLGLSRQKGRHACAFAIANEPIANFIPLTNVSGVTVTQYTASSVEASGVLKMDFLTINSLKDIRDAIRLIQERNGGYATTAQIIDGKKVPAHRLVPWNGKFYDIWDLPEDQDVFRDFCEGRTETVFQFNTPGALGWLKEFDHEKEVTADGTVHKALDSIEALAAFTALDRPGPLDYYVTTETGGKHNMLVEYAIRARGGKATGGLPILNQLLSETNGVIVYQEQLQRVYQVVGKTTAEEADEFRVHISKKQMAKVIKDKETFMRGAIDALGEAVATELWNSMETFGQYGFNKSHAVSYVILSYACAFLKHHYPLEWWTAVLRNADKNEINEKFWRFCGHLIDLPDVNKSGDQFEIVNERIRAPISLLHGVGEKAHQQLCEGRPYKDILDLCQKVEAWKKSHTTETSKMDEKTNTMKTTKRAGTSALNSRVVNTLIISGAMDSVFETEASVTDRLYAYARASLIAIGKDPDRGKKKACVPKKYEKFDDLARYQMRKEVLPAYGIPILPMLLTRPIPGLYPAQGEARAYFMPPDMDKERVEFVSLAEMEQADAIKPWPDDTYQRVAVAAYVLSERKFTYQEKKQACEYVLDIDGGRFQTVKWPPHKKDKLDDKYQGSWAGSIVIAVLTKWKESRPFGLDGLYLIRPPLDQQEEIEAEESPAVPIKSQTPSL